MKKLLFALTALMLVFVMALTGCSCIPAQPLEFNQNFSGSQGSTLLGASYKETLTYKVEYGKDYSTHLAKSNNIPDSIVPQFEGTYVTKFTASAILPENVNSNLNFEGGEIHHLQTELTIKMTLKNGKEFNDKVKSDSYFYSSGFSFAPIYAIQTAKNTLLIYDNSDFRTATTVTQYQTTYNSSSYKIEKRELATTDDLILQSADVDALHLDGSSLSVFDSAEYQYNVREVIDNTQLFFAMRNMAIEKDGSKNLPTVAPIYGESKTLLVKNYEINTKDFEIKNQGVNATYSVPLQYYTFSINATYNTGIPQIVAYQTKESTDANTNSVLSYKSLPVEIAQPLTEYGSSYLMVGVLKYTLVEVSY